jgi:hypothetical protein
MIQLDETAFVADRSEVRAINVHPGDPCKSIAFVGGMWMTINRLPGEVAATLEGRELPPEETCAIGFKLN